MRESPVPPPPGVAYTPGVSLRIIGRSRFERVSRSFTSFTAEMATGVSRSWVWAATTHTSSRLALSEASKKAATTLWVLIFRGCVAGL